MDPSVFDVPSDGESVIAIFEEKPIRKNENTQEENKTDEKENAEYSYGTVAEAKKLYEGPRKSNYCTNWVEEIPNDARFHLKKTKESSKRYAILARLSKQPIGGEPFQLHSVVIQSPHIRKILESVLEDYPKITPGMDDFTLFKPFEPIYHRVDLVISATEKEEDPTTKEHLQLLLKTLGKSLQETKESMERLVVHGGITYDLLWTIFKPGDVIYSTEDGIDRALRLWETEYCENFKTKEKHFSLFCEAVDFDGSTFGLRFLCLHLVFFSGTRQINDLLAFPLEMHSKHPEVKKRLITRGIEFVHSSGYHHKHYQGRATKIMVTHYGEEKIGKHHINGRVILDTRAYARFNPYEDDIYQLAPLRNQDRVEETTGSEADSHVESATELEWETTKQEPCNRKLTDVGYLICFHTIKGFWLAKKTWVNLYLENLRDIEWNGSIFDGLILPDGKKSLIKAFTHAQLNSTTKFDDIVTGKGKGFITLLSGPPGVGKTLTAEAVAEHMKVPLYMASVGEIGTIVKDVEENLSSILEMAAHWGAVLLLDEADIFLTKRDMENLQRNILVSIFLRKLEYYEGVLFLTTNRPETLDDAIASRIHLSLAYDNLPPSQRRKIWSNLLSSIPSDKNTIGEDELNLLQEWVLNGREIKNLIRSALLLANYESTPLNLEYLSQVRRFTVGIGENIIG